MSGIAVDVNWMLCSLDDDDDTPDDPVIVPVKTQNPVHLLPHSCIISLLLHKRTQESGKR